MIYKYHILLFILKMFKNGDQVVFYCYQEKKWFYGKIKNIKGGYFHVIYDSDQEVDIETTYDYIFLKDNEDFKYYINPDENMTLKKISKITSSNLENLFDINKNFVPKLKLKSKFRSCTTLIKIPKDNYVKQKVIVKTKKKRKRSFKENSNENINFDKKSKRRTFTVEERNEILKDQDYKCNICFDILPSKKGIILNEIDHIIPISKYGTNIRDNLHALCPWCHNEKSNKHDRNIINALVINSKNTGEVIKSDDIIDLLRQRSSFRN